MIDLRDVTKFYGAKRGVEKISFTISEGEIVGLLGPNGSGKSTIMNMLAGYIPPTSGSIEVGGIDVVENPDEASKKVGFMPENPALYPEMEVKEFLTFVTNIRTANRSDRKAHVVEIMEMCGVSKVSGRLIRNLSKGYRQRVSLGAALVGYPQTLILDEPTAGFDPKQIVEVRDLIVSLSQKHTILLSSHILTEISAVCEKVIIISQGRMVANDSISLLGKGEADIFMLRLKAGAKKALSVIEAMDGIHSIKQSPGAQSSGCSFIVNAKPGIREELFFKLAAKKMPIIEMRTLSATLEDVFLELTGEKEGA